MSNDSFEVILLVGRPASGKSEILDFLNRTNADDRRLHFNIGEKCFLEVNSQRIPYVVFENEEDATTRKPDLLGSRLETTMGRLLELRMHP
jgi:hypothetical protein